MKTLSQVQTKMKKTQKKSQQRKIIKTKDKISQNMLKQMELNIILVMKKMT